MPNPTDDTPAVDKAETGTPTPDTRATDTAADTSGNKGYEGRIHGLTAERDRHRDANAELQRKYDELVEKTKSEDERRVDALVQERVNTEYGEKLQRLESYEAELGKKRDALVETLPEEHRGMIDPHATVVQQIKQAEGVLSLLKIDRPTPTGGSANPPTKEVGGRIAYSDITRWGQNMDVWREHREEVRAAQREGRIDYDR